MKINFFTLFFLTIGLIAFFSFKGLLLAKGKDGKKAELQLKNSFINIRGGCFKMGSLTEDPSEKPVHEVCLKPFKIQQYEVTVEEYRQCIAANKCPRPETGLKTCNFDRIARENHPVNCVDWWMAKRYCAFIKGELPTEAQWEFSARGANNRRYPWGDKESAFEKKGLANCKNKTCGDEYPETAPVGSFKKGRSVFGLYDMAGNVWEWVEDTFEENYYSVSPKEDPVNLKATDYKVIRGGGWLSDSTELISTKRLSSGSMYRSPNLGFRCAANVSVTGN